MPNGSPLWRDRRVWVLISFILVIFAIDFYATTVAVLAFYVLVVVASASMGRPRLTAALAVLVLVVALAGAFLNDFSPSDTLRRGLVITFTGVVSGYLAYRVGRANRDLTHQRDLYRLLVENASDVVARSASGTVVWVSDPVERLLGWAPGDVVGRPFLDLVHPDDRAVVQRLEEEVASGQQVGAEVRLRTANGDYRWVDVQMRPEADETGGVLSVVSSWRDAQAIHEARADLERRAAYDDLTGALRREGALDRLEALGRPTRRTGLRNAVLFCDVDDFKSINDTYGHAVGDEVLRTIYRLIRSIVRDNDTVARFGGDEFLVILSGIRHLQDAGAVAEKIRQAVCDPINAVAGEVNPTLSFGVTLAREGESADAAIARADQGMYAAKRTGPNAVVCLESADKEGQTNAEVARSL